MFVSLIDKALPDHIKNDLKTIFRIRLGKTYQRPTPGIWGS
jgi:hypothetical protein